MEADSVSQLTDSKLKSEESPDGETKLPFSQMAIVLCIQLCEALNVNILFPFLAFMVEDFGYTGNRLGIYAGILAASFCGAQFFSSMIWGAVSDRYGRKPAIFIGTLGAAMGMLLFGFSATYTQAVAGRIVSGILSGNLGVVKSLLTEITDETNRGRGFSYMSIAWAAGTVLAPLAGGLLCKPVKKYPTLFSPTSLFAKYPYALPNLLIVIFQLFSALICLIFMKETRFSNQKNFSTNHSDSSVKKGRNQKQSTIKADETTDKNAIEMSSMNILENGKSHVTTTTTSTEYVGIGGFEGISDIESAIDSNSMKSKADLIKLSNMIENYDQLLKKNVDEVEEEDDGSDDDDDDNNSDDLCLCCCEFHNTVSEYNEIDLSEHGGTSSNKMEGGSIMDHPESSSSTTTIVSGTTRESSNISISSDEILSINSFSIEDEDDDDDDDDNDGRQSMNTDITETSSHGFIHNLQNVDKDNKNKQGLKNNSMKSKLNKRVHMKFHKKSNKNDSIICHRNVILTTSLYGLLAFAYIIWDETIPLFLKLSPLDGGFGFDSTQIGSLLSLTGVVMLGFNCFLLPIIAKSSKRFLFIIGLFTAVPQAYLLPIMGSYNRFEREERCVKHEWMLTIVLLLLLLVMLCNTTI